MKFFKFIFACNDIFLIAILHRDLRNDFFFNQFTFSNFYLDFYFPFSIWTFISFLDFYFLFCTNSDLILDFFQVFLITNRFYYWDEKQKFVKMTQ